MGLFRATVKCDFPIGSGGGTNTWHLRTLSSEGSTTEVAALMGLVQGFYTGIAILCQTSYSWSWDGLVQEIATPSPSLLEAATPWQVFGSDSGTSFASAPSMACVSWRSSLASRRGRGRTFIGPISANAVQADGTLAPSQLAQLRSEAAELVSNSLADTNGALVVWSEVDNVGRDFVASSVTDQVAVLRSRR